MRQNILLILCLFVFWETFLTAQERYFTRSGKVEFYSKAPIEDIKAVNNQLSCIFEVESNRIVANVLIKAFEFEKALMQKHFNENYMESERFPKATFKGKINSKESLDFKSNWNKSIDYEGDMTIHGISRKMKGLALITCKNGTITISSEFYIHLNDFAIKIPSTLINNISEKIQIKVNLSLNELKK